jgi:FtsZ-interacting cell division protein ZipA
MDVLESLSADLQLVLLIVGIALLFGLVYWNNKRNQHKRYNRSKRNFRQNVLEKKEKWNKE